jgi:hypothetical protein
MITEEKDIQIKSEPDEELPFKYAITSYGADFDVDGLVKRIEREDIFVPSFQRRFVWNITQASRFVESLLLGLPVPGIFLSKDEKTQKLLVIDGQQRLHSLLYFYKGVFLPNEKVFALSGIETRFRGATYSKLPPEDRRRLDDSIIHATIIRQDEPDDGNSSIYFVFERLNTGGTQLQPQEIRTALYHGLFNDVLNELNKEPSWRALYGPTSPRKRDVELILRFFALLYKFEQYHRPIREFLNEYMGSNRNLEKQDKEQLSRDFLGTVRLIERYIGGKAFKPKRALNAAIFDSLMLGVSKRLNKGDIINGDKLRDEYNKLLANLEYIRVTETATSDEDNVRRRIEIAIEAFEDVV